MSNKYVYFMKPIGFDGPIKIGCSGWPRQRLLDLSAWSPFPLEILGQVPGSRADEYFLHCCFSDIHLHFEWFKSDPKLMQAIELALEAKTIDVLRDILVPKASIHKRGPRQSRMNPRRWIREPIYKLSTVS